MTQDAEHRFWIWLDDAAAGPFSVGQIHRMLAVDELDWQTAACAVGEQTWRPLLATPNLGPMGEAAVPPASSAADFRVSSAQAFPVLVRLLHILILTQVGIFLVTFALVILGSVLGIVGAHENSVFVVPKGVKFAVLVLLAVGTIASWIGLWRIRNWGRWLYLGVVFAGHAFFVLGSPFIVSTDWRLPIAVSEVGSTLGGILIGIAFFSPLAREFRRRGEQDESLSARLDA